VASRHELNNLVQLKQQRWRVMGEETEAESGGNNSEFDKVSSLQRWSKDQIMATVDSGGGSIRTTLIDQEPKDTARTWIEQRSRGDQPNVVARRHLRTRRHTAHMGTPTIEAPPSHARNDRRREACVKDRV
jgi:hypothetical protein